jgi:hypothetical protein
MTVRVRDNAAESRLWGSSSFSGPIVRTVTIATVCPVCGGPRGQARPGRVVEDGEWRAVDVWDNPCGHVDMYAAVVVEAAAPTGGAK